MKVIKISTLSLMLPAICLAKREAEPTKPYIFRYASSVLVNAPAIIIVMFVLYCIYSIGTKVDSKKFIKNTIFGIAIVAAIPLIDDWNDESWNPAIFGAFGSVFIIPVIAYINSDGLKEWIRTFIPVVLFFPLLIAFVYFNTSWQRILINLGMSVSW